MYSTLETSRKRLKIEPLEFSQEFTNFDSLNMDSLYYKNNESTSFFILEDILLTPEQIFHEDAKLTNSKEDLGVQNRCIESTYPIHILQLKKVKELREIVDELKESYKIHFHWTWIQNKNDIIDLIVNPTDPIFQEKNPNFVTKRVYKKKRNINQI